jgi:hypothetical protein
VPYPLFLSDNDNPSAVTLPPSPKSAIDFT